MEPARLQFCGRFAGFRVWRSTRTPEQVESYRYLDCDPSDKLVVQYTVDQDLGGIDIYIFCPDRAAPESGLGIAMIVIDRVFVGHLSINDLLSSLCF